MVRRSLSEWPISQILKGKKDTITKRIEGVLQREQFIQSFENPGKTGTLTEQHICLDAWHAGGIVLGE